MATQGKNTPVPEVHGMDIVTALINLETYQSIIDTTGPHKYYRHMMIPHEEIILFRRVLNQLVFEGLSEHERSWLIAFRDRYKDLFWSNSVAEPPA